jgi:dephospho-CoA kinase
MRIIGLTGGIATGKSTVANILNKEYGLPVLNVDTVSRSITEPGSKTLAKIVLEFGDEALNKDGTMNRGFLRQKVISSPESKDALESIVIPSIQNWVSDTLQDLKDDGVKVVVIENALMIEKGTHDNYDQLIVVTCSPKTQIERVMERDNQTEEQAKGMIALQLPLEEKERLASYLIRNNGTYYELRELVSKLWDEVFDES